MTDYLLPDYLSKIQFYLMGTCSFLTLTKLQYLQSNVTIRTSTACMLQELIILRI